MNKILKEYKKPRIGLYSAGLKTYWSQFDGLYECLMKYNAFIQKRMEEFGIVYNYGMVDDEVKGREAGEYFNKQNVDIIFIHSATYFTSGSVLPLHQICKAPVVLLNLQPAEEMQYEKTSTAQWLAQCVACPVPELANAFSRSGIKLRFVNGLLGYNKNPEFSCSNECTNLREEAIEAWSAIEEWCMAAKIKRNLAASNFGFLGGYYQGMLDMYSDFTLLQTKMGISIIPLEMSDLDYYMQRLSEADIENKLKDINEFFVISDASPSDPIAKKAGEGQFIWSAKVAAAEEKLAKNYELDSISYYYHGKEDYYEEIQSGFITGFSLLNSRHVACAGEGDIKTAVAMKIADICERGGSFSEIVASDFNRNTIILGHDGPFHIAISDEKPLLRGMSVYHGKRGSGLSVEARVKPGPVTTLGLTQLQDGKLQLNISQGEAIDAPILLNGNTSTHVRFKKKVTEYMYKWFENAPTHHMALTVGNNESLFIKAADLLEIEYAVF